MLLTDSLTQILIYTLVSYPIIGGLSFIVSSLYYWLLMEKADQPRYLKKETPFITILVPAHNEEASIQATIDHLATQMNYPTDRYEIIIVNDGSTDRTGIILNMGSACERSRLLIIAGKRRVLIVL